MYTLLPIHIPHKANETLYTMDTSCDDEKFSAYVQENLEDPSLANIESNLVFWKNKPFQKDFDS